MSTQAVWHPGVAGQTGPLAFKAWFDAAGQLAYLSYPASTSMWAQIDLTLSAPSPVGGRLHVRTSASALGGSSTSSLRFDLGADGSIEAQAAAWQSGVSTMNFPVQIPAGGIVVRLTFQGGLTVGPATGTLTFNSNAHVEVQAEFFPNEPVFHVFDTTGATTGLAVGQSTAGSVTFSMTTPGHIPLLLALGTQPMVNQLLPTVTQLVSLDVVFAAGPVTTWALPPLPPGSVVYAQGLVIDSSGTLRSSNSVRGTWP